MKMSEKKYFEKFGYNYFGPLLLSYSCWLKENLLQNKIDKVYFLSRDGYVMKRAFDIIKGDDIKSYYFYTSRRAIIVPYLWMIKSKEEILENIVFNKKITVKSFIKKIGLEDYDLRSRLQNYNYNMDTELDIENLGKFWNFIDDIMPIIKQNSLKEWNSLCAYAKKNQFSKIVAIVDIGWNGTMQNAFQKIFQNHTFYGYYFGVNPFNKFDKLNLNGFLFNKNQNEELYKKFHYFINIFEFLFLAQHGSIKCYLNSEKEVEMYKYEYDDYQEKEIANIIQESAIKYIIDNKNAKLDKNKTIKRFANYFIKPNYKTAKSFGNLRFSDDDVKYIAKPRGLIKYIFKPSEFINDFVKSSWRIGFLKRLLIIPLPYYCINNFFRKVYLRKEK